MSSQLKTQITELLDYQIVGIDASRSIDTIQKTGVERVSDELIKTIVSFLSFRPTPPFAKGGGVEESFNFKDINFIFYTPQEISWLPKEKQRVLKWPFKYLWTQVRLAWEILRHPPDVAFFPAHTIPLVLLLASFLSFPRKRESRKIKDKKNWIPDQVGNDKMKIYKVIHDIAFKKEPKLYSFWQRLYLNLDLWLAIKLCQKIFVPTNKVKGDLLKYMAVNENKVVVVHHGYIPVTQAFRPEKRKRQILHIGRIEEKKNIVNLIKAFKIFSQKFPEYKLILAGKPDAGYKEIQRQISACPERSEGSNQRQSASIELLGYVSDEKKYELLAESACLILVSKEEGFGFPILEAFDFGLPVLAADIPVLREIGGHACLYVNADAPSEIADGLEKIVTDKDLRKQLIGQGSEQLKKFDWEITAKKYLEEILI